jgi:hypothetical protein
VTLPPFGPIRYGGPKPGAAVVDRHEDDEAPSWASIEEYAPQAPEAVPAVVETEPAPAEAMAAEPEVAEVEAAEAVEDDTGLFDETPVGQEAYAEREAPAWLDAAPAEPVADEPWSAAPEPEAEAEPEPEMTALRPVLPFTGPNDPTPIVNRAIERMTERSTEPHRMTPMRVTPLRQAAIAAPAPAVIGEGNARAVAAALELIAARVRRGELAVPGQMPKNDDPPALAAALAATLSALLGVRD